MKYNSSFESIFEHEFAFKEYDNLTMDGESLFVIKAFRMSNLCDEGMSASI